MVGAGEPESRCQAGVTGLSTADPQQQLPSISHPGLSEARSQLLRTSIVNSFSCCLPFSWGLSLA